MSTQTNPDYGRAGRNLPLATVVGVLLFAVFALSLIYRPFIFALLAAVVMLLAVAELSRALVAELPAEVRKVLLVSAPAMVLATYFGGPQWLLISFVIAVVAVLVSRLFHEQDKYVSNVSRAIFILTYAPLLSSFAVLLAAQKDGDLKVLTLVLLTIGADIGGYFAGVLFGKHPMAPRISPKKSWEGLIGAVLLEIGIGIALWIFLFDGSWWKGALAGAIMAVTATFGDLVESMIKRDLGIKDMSRLVPGHGGIMDRLDSLVINAAVAWALFALLV
ncbi:MAG: phosphatidate cytidylyltransferase [Actinobacteria bacterium]|nr:phosphatidate cytidylyltransferase [Actinomycetota bacterium]